MLGKFLRKTIEIMLNVSGKCYTNLKQNRIYKEKELFGSVKQNPVFKWCVLRQNIF